jgi:hypothetical protein
MKTYITYIFIFLFSTILNAQLGINTTNPKAAIEIKSNTGGLLIPRVKTTEVTNNEPGLLVFNTDTGNLSIKQEDQSWKSPKIGIEPTQFTKALKFDGENHFLSMPSSNTANNNFLKINRPWSISFIIKPYSNENENESETKMGLLDLRGNNGIRIWIKDKNLHLIYGNFNNVQKRYYLYTLSSKIKYDQWNYITITYNGNELQNNNWNPIKVYIGHTSQFNTNRENTTRNKPSENIDLDNGFINIGRSKTDTSGSDFYFRGKIASINLVNREISNNDLALFTLSPRGWMHKEHYDDSNDLIASDITKRYDFRIYIKGNTNDNIQLTAESNKVWLFGNGEFDGTFLNNYHTIKNQAYPNQGTPDLGVLNLKGGLTPNDIIPISDLNIKL